MGTTESTRKIAVPTTANRVTLPRASRAGLTRQPQNHMEPDTLASTASRTTVTSTSTFSITESTRKIAVPTMANRVTLPRASRAGLTRQPQNHMEPDTLASTVSRTTVTSTSTFYITESTRQIAVPTMANRVTLPR